MTDLNCKYCEQKDIEYIKHNYNEKIQSFVTKSDDCIFKNFSIYDYVIKNNLKGNLCVDIGAGTSRLGYFLAERFNNVYIVDMAENNPFSKGNLHHVRDNFFNWTETQEEESYDLVVESCAITHFEHDKIKNHGIEKCARSIYKILKKGSYFIMSSDVIDEASKDSEGQKEFIEASNIIKIFENNNFKIVKNFNYDTKNDDCVIKIHYNNNPNFTLKYASFVFVKE